MARFAMVALLSLMLSSYVVLPSAFAIGAALPETPTLEGGVSFGGIDYRLGAGDVLSYEVLFENDYTRPKVLISPDGLANFPGVGTIKVENLTITQLETLLTGKLKKYLVKPQVSVTLINPKPASIYVTGAVNKPGLLQMAITNDQDYLGTSSHTPLARLEPRLTNVLSYSGGVLLNADLTRVTIKNEKFGTSKVVNVWDIIKKGDQAQDLLLNNGDTLFVPTLTEGDQVSLSDEDYKVLLRSSVGPKYFPVRVVGKVSAQGVISLDAQSPYLNSALARAGGLLPQAMTNKLVIRRFNSPTSFQTFTLDPTKDDIVLRPNDVIFVPEHKLAKASRVMQDVSGVMSPVNSTAYTGAAFTQIFGLGGWQRP
jgi:polysaccharide biosynthesis/export protein